MTAPSTGAALQPADPAFASRVRASFERQGVMHTLRARLAMVEAGRVMIEAEHDAAFAQQHGFLHAGIVATLMDSACGYAAFSLMAADAAILTVEFKVNLLAPAKGPHFRFEGQVIKPGRTLQVVEGRAWQRATPDAEPTLAATMTATTMTMTGRGLNG
jgi:uncharacterized protein (TIGR00369 family)